MQDHVQVLPGTSASTESNKSSKLTSTKRKASKPIKSSNPKSIKGKAAVSKALPATVSKEIPAVNPSKCNRNLSDEEFYDEFKKSYNNAEIAELDDVSKKDSHDMQVNCDQLKLFDLAIQKRNREILYYYCLRGRNLSNMKAILRKGNGLKSKALKRCLDNIVRQTFKLAKDDSDLKGYSESNRDFFIRLYNLSIEYPQIMYVTLPYGDIKDRSLTTLRKFMDEDKTFDWKAKR